ncbi:MAG: hypothetical protein GY847_19815 [Proteobacteria bacterium]|nr:hypothetical protein [Pseudomonadota bacterium]
MSKTEQHEPNWDSLYEVASTQEGLFTTQQAEEAGYSSQLLDYHIRAKRVVRVRRGIYRLVHFPAGEHEELVVAWLWSERMGIVSHQTALSLHGLSDILPVQIHLTLPNEWRRRRFRVPEGIVLHYADLPEDERSWFVSVPITKPGRTPTTALWPDCRLSCCCKLSGRRQLLVFDRFLARVIATFGESVILKGGLVLELRLDKARTTKDIDLRMVGLPDEVFSGLQEAGRLELGDFMNFEISPDKNHPEIVGDGIQYDGHRYRSECKLAGKLYGQPFGVDVAFGDPIYGDPEVVTADDILAFANIYPPALRIYPVETHIVEKLHAYTMPRSRINTRVKDLPDIALLATSRPIDSNKLQAALKQTFSFRKTHPIPLSLPAPPQAWDIPYTSMAREDHLIWSTLDEVTGAVRVFLDPILSGKLKAQWNPSEWKWSEE